MWCHSLKIPTALSPLPYFCSCYVIRLERLHLQRPTLKTLSSTFSSRVLFFHESLSMHWSVHANSAPSNTYINLIVSFLFKLLSFEDKALQELTVTECVLCTRQHIKPFMCMTSVNPQYTSRRTFQDSRQSLCPLVILQMQGAVLLVVLFLPCSFPQSLWGDGCP